MKKFDWYIIKKFFSTFFFCIFLFVVIAIAVDISEKADDFVKSGLSTLQIIQKYYLAFIPYIIALLFPLFVFIAVIFFTSKMAQNSEVVAILASGTSFNRFLRPYLIGGILLGLLLLVASNFWVPKANAIRTSFEKKYVDVNSTYDPLIRTNTNIYFRVDSNTYAGVRNYDTASKNGGPFFMQTVKGNQLVFNLRADNIRWDTAKRKWVLSQVFERKLNGIKENVSLENSRDMSFNFKPMDLSRDEYAKDKLASPELYQFISLEEQRGAETVNTLKAEQYRRFTTPVAVIILTLIGAVIACRRVRGGSGAHIAIGIVMACIFILMDRFSTIFSTKGSLPPIYASLIPDFVFSCIAVYLYRKAPK